MPAKDLEIREELNGNVVVLRLDGELNTHSFEMLNTSIQSQFDRDRFKLLLDLTGVNYISSTCVGVFLSAYATAMQNSGQIVILNPAPKVKVVFDLFGLTQMFKIATDMPGALALFA